MRFAKHSRICCASAICCVPATTCGGCPWRIPSCGIETHRRLRAGRRLSFQLFACQPQLEYALRGVQRDSLELTGSVRCIGQSPPRPRRDYFHGMRGLQSLVDEGSASSPYPSLLVLSPSISHDVSTLSSHPEYISRALFAQLIQCFVIAPVRFVRWQSRSHHRARCWRGA